MPLYLFLTNRWYLKEVKKPALTSGWEIMYSLGFLSVCDNNSSASCGPMSLPAG